MAAVSLDNGNNVNTFKFDMNSLPKTVTALACSCDNVVALSGVRPPATRIGFGAQMLYWSEYISLKGAFGSQEAHEEVQTRPAPSLAPPRRPCEARRRAGTPGLDAPS